MNINPAMFSMFCATTGAIITFAFGGWNQLMVLFTVAMAIDYVTGVAAAIKTGEGLSSKAGFWGLTRKALMLMVISLAHHVDLLMGTEIMKGAATYFYLSNELISITENCSRMGLPLPPKLKNFFALLKDKEAGGKDGGKDR
ncbi:phage holin family protein [Paenibacillus sp. 8b26]|uniref:phage holin family protein n=1 Tax=Paenibacillus sp. 8b26 TaxID=3424133 RepID=UPI003D6461C5